MAKRSESEHSRTARHMPAKCEVKGTKISALNEDTHRKRQPYSISAKRGCNEETNKKRGRKKPICRFPE